MIKKDKRGFTFVEIMIAIAIISILAGIAIKNFVKARENAQRNACIASLRQISGAVQRWAIDTSAESDAPIDKVELAANYLKVWPKEGIVDYACPPDISTVPKCPSNNPTHTI